MKGLFMRAVAGYVRREALTAWDLRKHCRRTGGSSITTAVQVARSRRCKRYPTSNCGGSP